MSLPHTFANLKGKQPASYLDDCFVFLLNLIQTNGSGAMAFSDVPGSPFALTASWQKVATITQSTTGLLVGDTATAPAAFDIFWTSVPAGSDPPTSSELGLPIGQFYDFPIGRPLGDLYLRSANSLAVATVQTASA